MKTLIKIALGFLLLVSAAAATGNFNNVYVDIYAEATGNCVSGNVNLAQITDASAFVEGSCNDVYQCLGTDGEDGYGLFADDNCLAGNGRQTNLIQRADLIGNATGCNNCVSQDLNDLDAIDNCVTDSNLTQWSIMKADTIGSWNGVDQCTASDAYENCLTLSDQKQMADFDACTTGDYNCVSQDLYQDACNNCVTTSCLWQQTAKVADILGSYNSAYQDNNLQYADDNCLTGSVLNQMICDSAQITGTCNEVDQGSCNAIETDACNNCLTNAGMLQSINSKALIAGCNNYVNHEVYLDTDCNSLTGGMLSQISTIVSND